MRISVMETDLYVVNVTRRMAFHFGNVSATDGPQILLSLTLDVDGTEETGLAMGTMTPMWFFKDPEMTLEEGTDALLDAFAAASQNAEAAGPQNTVFALWKSLFDAVESWANDTSYPPLLWSYGVSLVEQAAIDAYCRATNTTFAEAVRTNALGIRPGELYDELEGAEPADLLPDQPSSATKLRHTVGLSDPLTPDDVELGDRLDDGLPQTLAEYVERQGIDRLKIKLAADAADADRLKRIASVLDDSGLEEYAFTLDANEQYDSVDALREQWEAMQSDPELAPFLEHLLYVEQPLPRDEAFSEATRAGFEEWDDRPPIIIDESDDQLDSLGRALETGYAGTSHKNCKGVFKGIVNQCLVEHRRRTDPDGEYLMSGEDLTTLGPIELMQDLAVMAVMGMTHVERNGHHYYRGLSMYPEDVQGEVLERHNDLYHRTEAGYPAVRVEDGRIEFESVNHAPFGRDVELDATQFTPAEEWTIDSIYE